MTRAVAQEVIDALVRVADEHTNSTTKMWILAEALQYAKRAWKDDNGKVLMYKVAKKMQQVEGDSLLCVKSIVDTLIG